MKSNNCVEGKNCVISLITLNTEFTKSVFIHYQRVIHQ